MAIQTSSPVAEKVSISSSTANPLPWSSSDRFAELCWVGLLRSLRAIPGMKAQHVKLPQSRENNTINSVSKGKEKNATERNRTLTHSSTICQSFLRDRSWFFFLASRNTVRVWSLNLANWLRWDFTNSKLHVTPNNPIQLYHPQCKYSTTFTVAVLLCLVGGYY